MVRESPSLCISTLIINNLKHIISRIIIIKKIINYEKIFQLIHKTKTYRKTTRGNPIVIGLTYS